MPRAIPAARCRSPRRPARLDDARAVPAPNVVTFIAADTAAVSATDACAPTLSPTTPAPSPGPGGPTSPPTTSRPSPSPSLRPTPEPTRSPDTLADALVHMRVHRPQNDGHMVRERQLRPRVLGLLRHVLRRAYTSGRRRRRSLSRRLGQRPRPRRDRHCGRHRRRPRNRRPRPRLDRHMCRAEPYAAAVDERRFRRRRRGR